VKPGARHHPFFSKIDRRTRIKSGASFEPGTLRETQGRLWNFERRRGNPATHA
jgi:hypothetical protein